MTYGVATLQCCTDYIPYLDGRSEEAHEAGSVGHACICMLERIRGFGTVFFLSRWSL